LIQIAPFRALRYNPEAISFISRVVAPPYDLVDAEQADELRARDPHNAIRLVLGKAPDGGRPERDYQRAATVLASWRREGVLIREPEPAIYLCEQTFSANGQSLVRRGLLSTILLEDLSSGRVLPHEHTREPAKADRLRLMQACCASLSPVFGIFADTDGAIDEILAGLGSGEPLYEFEAPDGIGYRMWRVTDAGQIRRVAGELRDEKFVIADGHHRYETALTYREQHRSAAGPPGSAPEDFLLAFCVSTKDKGLKILPTHRLVKGPGAFPKKRLLAIVTPYFDLRESRIENPAQLRAIAGGWGADEVVIGCYLRGGRFMELRVRDGALATIPLPDGPPEWRSVPVMLLRYGILDPLFGMSPDFFSDPTRLRYEADAEEVYWAVESGRFDAGFLLAPLHPDTLARVTQTGRRMPPKTTFFYPKIPSGLVYYPFENADCLPVLASP